MGGSVAARRLHVEVGEGSREINHKLVGSPQFGPVTTPMSGLALRSWVSPGLEEEGLLLMPNFNLRRPAICLAGAVAFGTLVSATPGLADITVAPVEEPVVASPAPEAVEPLAEIEEAVAQLEEVPAEHIGEGEASYYGYELAGNRTASGERFNPKALTAAHRTLPLGTKLRVVNKLNGKSVIVRINDRGPFVKRRLIDMSLAAAQQINMVRAGKALVRLERLR
jgi:rare lipoprotein A